MDHHARMSSNDFALFVRSYAVHQRLFAAGICALMATAMLVEHRPGSGLVAVALTAYFLRQAWLLRSQF
jgi:hypothetical protein